MESLSALVDARDSYTAGHSCRVAETSIVIGRELGLEGDKLETLRRAALFHDIGKVGLPDSILLKAGPLTDVEWTAMQRHSVTRARIIARLGFLDRAVPGVHHHENYDGSGYPDGLAGDSIPLHARIIHVADAFDSMLSSRVYRNARPLAAALDEIVHQRGTYFCPHAADALVSAIGRQEQNRAA